MIRVIGGIYLIGLGCRLDVYTAIECFWGLIFIG